MKYLILLLTAAAFAQTPVDFLSAKADISLDYKTRSVSGDAVYEFEADKRVEQVSIDAQNMDFSDVKLDGKSVKFSNSGKQITIEGRVKKGRHTITLHYSAQPKQTLYFVTDGPDEQIWTQGQGKYTSHWFPSFDDVNEKVVFGLSISYASDYTVLSNGLLKGKKASGNRVKWVYQMQKPMSSYLLMLAVGKLVKSEIQSASGITSELYLGQNEEQKREPTYRYSKQIFDYLEQETVPYAWEIYRQIPVRDFLYGGMENTSATIFTRDYVCDSTAFNDRNYVNVNAHELAHQWFGDLVTAKSGKDHWLQEGFATYYALLAEREVFGDDYFYWKLYENAEDLQQANKTDTIPILNEKASSLSYYQKGAWALHVIRESIGAENFKKAVKAYLEKYKFRNVVTEDFLAEIRKVSGFDTENFRKRWLESGKFEVEEAIGLLQKNAFMRQYFEIGSLAGKPLSEKKQRFTDVLQSEAFYPVKVDVLYQSAQGEAADRKTIFELALSDKNVNVQKAAAQILRKIPLEFGEKYKALLDADSYVIQEIALNALCTADAANRAQYLDKMDGRIGLNDKNIRLLWLALSLTTKDYRADKKAAYYDELLSYADPGQEASVRQSALEKLFFLNKGDTNALPLLVKALVHHKWQLTKYARDTVREKLKLPNHREYFVQLLPSLSEAERAQLQRLIDEK